MLYFMPVLADVARQVILSGAAATIIPKGMLVFSGRFVDSGIKVSIAQHKDISRHLGQFDS